MTQQPTAVARAPGKVMLAGEYAVLLPGGACLVAAVERRLEARASPAERWSVRAGPLRWTEGAPVPAGLEFAVAAVRAVAERYEPPPREVEVAGSLAVDGVKLGLGGSAAATVAAAFAAAQGSGAGKADLWSLAHDAHRLVQGGRGSGADVAACVHGGFLRYVSAPREASPVAVHPEVRLLLAWSGVASPTVPAVERFEAFVRREPAEARAFLDRSTAAVHALQDALGVGSMAELRAAFSQARTALKRAEAGMGVDLETEPLRRASDVAWRAGGCARISGAGGGDCAVVLAVGDDLAARVEAALTEAGLRTFRTGIACRGVEVA